MIQSYDEIEYSDIIKDVISTLKSSEKFILKIWVDGSEVPFKIGEVADIEFLKESVKISSDEGFTWILYGIIMVIQVIV